MSEEVASQSETSFDAIVIGAGVIGSSVALELTRKGFRTLCVDKLPGAGQGSTSSSSAVIRFNYSTAAGVAMAWESFHEWSAFSEHLGDIPGPIADYVTVGMCLFKSPGTNEDAFLPIYERFGVRHEELDITAAAEKWPWFDLHKFGPPTRLSDDRFWADPTELLAGASFTPDAGYVSDPMLSAQNLASAAAAEGATFWFKETVTEIMQSDGRVAGVALASGQKATAPVVVNVAGPHSFAINTLAGVLDDMTIVPKPMRREVHVTPAPTELDYDSDGVMFADLDVGVYSRPERGNNVLIGGVEPECDPLEWIDEPDDASMQLDDHEFELNVMRTARRISGLGVPPQKRGVVGVYDASDDWTPIYDRSELPGFYMAIGTSGNQFKNAITAGYCMAELIAAVEAGHDHDADPLVVNGRHTGNPIDLGTFSRKRAFNADSPATVLG